MSKHILKTKKATVQHFKTMLSIDDKWAIRGLMKIYEAQTPQEQNNYSTVENNGVGFNRIDAKLMVAFARQYADRRFLSNKQLELVKKKIPKYAGQLYNISMKRISNK